MAETRSNLKEYDPAVDLPIIKELAESGARYVDIAAAIGVTPSRLRRWYKPFPEIKETIRLGQEVAIQNGLKIRKEPKRINDNYCWNCGKLLDPEIYPSNNTRYCSDKCKNEARKKRERAKKTPPDKSNKPKLTMKEILEGMKREKMQYGEYVARHGL